MVLFWEGLQSFKQEVMLSFFLLETFRPAWISRWVRLSCERNCNGFSVKCSTWASFQSAYSTAGHKIPEPWVRCQVCVCLERCIVAIAVLPCSAVSMFPLPKGSARRANRNRDWLHGTVTTYWGNAFHLWIVSILLEKHCNGMFLHIVQQSWAWVPPQNCVALHRWLPKSAQLWNEVRNIHGG